MCAYSFLKGSVILTISARMVFWNFAIVTSSLRHAVIVFLGFVNGVVSLNKAVVDRKISLGLAEAGLLSSHESFYSFFCFSDLNSVSNPIISAGST